MRFTGCAVGEGRVITDGNGGGPRTWAMTDNATEQAIEMMVQRLVERFDPDQIILFGSQARGTAGPGSDVD